MPQTHSIRPSHTGPSFFNLAAFGLILLMGGLGVAYWLDAAVKPASPVGASVFGTPFMSKNLLGMDLQIPISWFIAVDQSTSNELDYLDLELLLKFAADADLTTVKLHFAPANSDLASAELLDNVYLLRFTPEQLRGPNGLIGKPLRQEEGFQNETIWYDPISSNPFVTKCIDLGANTAAPNCLRTVLYTPHIAVTYQFNENQLVHWRSIDAKLATFTEQLR